MRSLAVAAFLLLLASSGCKEFKYFDMHVRFDASMFDVVSVGSLDHCTVVVSGADSDSFRLNQANCPNHIPTQLDKLDSGTFEFSSFADSGNMTFTVQAWQGVNESNPNCKLGEGVATVPVSGGMTIKGDISIKRAGPGCTTSGGTGTDGG